ncbi:MAG: ATP-binding cassette domain-containing protein, partial [Pseudomonadota bacterium]|nr:ATP-binding cassette domain-containing protein [Pseudomonadota bacterium]
MIEKHSSTLMSSSGDGTEVLTDAGFISLLNVSKLFGDFLALDSVNLDIDESQKIVICGPSGSGKSTLIRCINRLEQHDEGRIAIDGVPIDDSAAARAVLRNNVGMVFQQFNLFPHLSILENLTLGPLRARGMATMAARELAEYYLERV